MSKTLTANDFIRAATRLKCEVAAIRAVDATESNGKGFYADGFPVILFERHYFHRLTKGRFDRSNPRVSNSSAGGYKENSKSKFNEAFALDPEAAMKSCSWGRYQIMGANHKVCGFATVNEFVDAMKESEGEHLDAFVTFVISNKLAVHLRNHNWAAFARGYNGAGYKKNNYDVKMANAYKKFLKTPISASLPAAPAAPAPTPLVGASTDAPSITEAAVVVNAPPADGSTTTATKMSIGGIVLPGFLAVIIKAISDIISQGFISAGQIGEFVMKLVMDNQKYVLWIVIAGVVMIVIKKAFKQVTLLFQMYIAARKDLNTVKVKPQ